VQASEQQPCCERLFLAFRSTGLTDLLVQILTKHEVNRHEKDVRIAIVHFDLVRYSSVMRNCHLILIAWQARALVHIGSLNRKSRPAKSVGDPLSKLLKNLRAVIQEFNKFCECV